MNIENYIESKYRELQGKGLNIEYIRLYSDVKHKRLREIMATLHYYFIALFKIMNERLPTEENKAHFWADPSRDLINIIEITIELFHTLRETKYAFEIDDYYYKLIEKCKDFLQLYGGSTLPAHMEKIELYYILPIFKNSNNITVKNINTQTTYKLKLIGEGSYANVYKYKDTFYNRNFVLKRAKKDLLEKELFRFKKEFEEMKEFSSPYIIEVYCYNENRNEYVMEYMDYTLDSYITKNNSNLSIQQRKGIIQQILKAFSYVHSKNRLHRDISPKNILIKEYEDILVVKIADFGLVKIPDSKLTTISTEFKGYFNDPALVLEGFNSYNILHETYALTRIVHYVMTGKTNINIDKIKNSSLNTFIQKGLNPDKTKRFQNISEMIQQFRIIY